MVDQLLLGIGITDPMDAILGLGILHELWVGGEPAGYATWRAWGFLEERDTLEAFRALRGEWMI